MQNPTLLVLAAGMGSRYGGLKQIEPMGPGGETILDYSVHDAIRAGFGKVVFVIREEFEADFRASVGAKFSDRIEVAYAFQQLEDIPGGFAVPSERTKPWGTAHAVYAARHEVTEPFAVINADDFYGADAYRTAAEFLRQPDPDPSAYCMVGYYLRNTLSDHGGVNRGVTSHSDHLLQHVEEVLDIRRREDGLVQGSSRSGEEQTVPDDAIVSMNFWGFPAAFFTQLEAHFAAFLKACDDPATAEFYIPTVVDDLIAAGEARCHILATTATWFGVTYPADKPIVVETIQALVGAGEYPSPLV